MSKSYTEMVQYSSYEDRLRYLLLHSKVGYETFGFDRIFNQIFYASPEWKLIRRDIILRDNGCDLGVTGHEILGRPFLVHHIDPITMDDINKRSSKLFDPNNLITTIYPTHQIIHYGSEALQPVSYEERKPNDMIPWKH